MIGAPLPSSGPRRDRRRELWARWASVAAKREAALDADDVETFLALDAQQEEIEAEARDSEAQDQRPTAMSDPEVRARMEEILARERRIQRRLRALRSSTLDEIRRLRDGVPGNARHARSYIRQDEAATPSQQGLDVRT